MDQLHSAHVAPAMQILVAEDEIYCATVACAERFDVCGASPALREHAITIRGAQGDFNLWCSAIKATSRSKASLDYRLRNNQDVRELVCGLLAGLATSLGRLERRAAAIFGDAELPVDATTELSSSPSSTDSPASWDAISECSNPGSAHDYDEPSMDPVMAECLAYVKITLDQLARISLAIRKSGDKYRFEKADAELNEESFEEFRNHLVSVIRRAFPDPKAQALTVEEKMRRVSSYQDLTPIQKRLVHANILRRHRIEFITKSRKQGQRPAPKNTALTQDLHRLDETSAPTTSIARSQIYSQIQGPVSSLPPASSTIQATAATSVAVTAAATATDVDSKLDVRQYLSAQSPSNVTNLTRVGSTQAYPNCPKAGSDDLLICPYCDDVLPSYYAKRQQSWKSHVAQDIMPYSCFMEGCETPYELYLTAEKLDAHVMEMHSSMCWTCNLCRSGDQATGGSLANTRYDFSNPEAWQDHVREVHSDQIKVPQLPVFAELSRRPVIGPLSCPLCPFFTDCTDSKIDDHILQHLHEFSLRALPDSHDPVAEERSKASQASGSLSHVKEAGLEEQCHLEFSFQNTGQWSTEMKWLIPDGPITVLASLIDDIINDCSADPTKVEFWSFHLFKVAEALGATKSVPKIDMTKEMAKEIHDQASISIRESLDLLRKTGQPNHRKDCFFLSTLPLRPSPITRVLRQEKLEDEIEDYLFEQGSLLSLGSSSQPKHQPRIILTGGSAILKRDIAWELARHIHHKKPDCSIFWVNASRIRSVSLAYRIIWEAAGKPGSVASLETSLTYYLNWVFSQEWFMILHSIDRQTLALMQSQGWLPSGLGGRLLLTTEDTSCLSLLGQAKEVRVPPEEKGEVPFYMVYDLDAVQGYIMEMMWDTSLHKEEQFVLRSSLKPVLNIWTVEHVLNQATWLESGFDTSKVAQFIIDKALSVFAILIKMGTPNLINNFYRNDFSESMLPIIYEWPMPFKSCFDETFNTATNATLQEIFTHDEWTLSNIMDFCSAQWEFFPLVFTEERFLYKISRFMRLPYTPAAKELKSASSEYSRVEKRSIYRECFKSNIQTAEDDDRNYCVAVKTLTRNDQWAVESEASVYQAIRGLRSVHLTKAIACISRDPFSQFVFPLPEYGNLRDFWLRQEDAPRDHTYFLRVFQQLTCLACAMHELHCANIRHGNLRPENIGCFKTSNGLPAGDRKDHDAMVRLAIMDVGIADIRSHQRYVAPEEDMPQEPRSRRSDVWSMGCIFLEFAIWLIYGAKRVRDFTTDDDPRFAKFFITNEVFYLRPSVSHIMDEMQGNPCCSHDTAIRRLINLVSQKMLIIDAGHGDHCPQLESHVTCKCVDDADRVSSLSAKNDFDADQEILPERNPSAESPLPEIRILKGRSTTDIGITTYAAPAKTSLSKPCRANAGLIKAELENIVSNLENKRIEAIKLGF
ncbi:hypothetical protein F4802DRAFT_433418 [Xylaria palmicola]|nr:hypothetical protein F4802DRAFT_433418 [Xylaria palmicola]